MDSLAAIAAYAARFRTADGQAVAEPVRRARAAALSPDLARLEAEAIHILREVAAVFRKPVMLYSIGKDSTVMLHLALKAFWPARLPFSLLHVDSLWEFRAMAEFRDALVRALGVDLIVHVNEEGAARGIDPFVHGSALHTEVMRTAGLLQALTAHGFDAAIGGGRRDEEKSRAKERIFSLRDAHHGWDPRRQRPEFWRSYNSRIGPDESMRVFPLSNWTELDVWRYIAEEAIPVVPLYFAAERPTVERDGVLLMVDDARLPLHPGEVPQQRRIRFRTLGCYPLTGAFESAADTLPAIVAEMAGVRTSERQGRIIDHDGDGSMEKKKRLGYF
ncbi:MAG: sulfate adenylyltransferase subunit CysD [Sandarakinorhabdus sp.]|jgi:sulfate adenylyltransferase subunit 2|nr:sulfate adenylyltransferase subunit CysD [Sandarakinorhabdus sp.]